MIVVAALLLARVVPRTKLAMRTFKRIRFDCIGVAGYRRSGKLQKAALEPPVVRNVVVEQEFVLGAVAEQHVGVLRQPPLQPFEMLAVVAKLDEVIWLGIEAELRVDGLVTEVAEI